MNSIPDYTDVWGFLVFTLEDEEETEGADDEDGDDGQADNE